jgi:hypothetical protein
MTPLHVMARAFDIRYRPAALRYLMISNAARVIPIANRMLLSRASTPSPLIRLWVIDFDFIARSTRRTLDFLYFRTVFLDSAAYGTKQKLRPPNDP